jgi:hypothetical protein
MYIRNTSKERIQDRPHEDYVEDFEAGVIGIWLLFERLRQEIHPYVGGVHEGSVDFVDLLREVLVEVLGLRY